MYFWEENHVVHLVKRPRNSTRSPGIWHHYKRNICEAATLPKYFSYLQFSRDGCLYFERRMVAHWSCYKCATKPIWSIKVLGINGDGKPQLCMEQKFQESQVAKSGCQCKEKPNNWSAISGNLISSWLILQSLCKCSSTQKYHSQFHHFEGKNGFDCTCMMIIDL